MVNQKYASSYKYFQNSFILLVIFIPSTFPALFTFFTLVVFFCNFSLIVFIIIFLRFIAFKTILSFSVL